VITDASGFIDSVTARFAEVCGINPKVIRKLHLNIFSLCRNLKKIYRAFNRKLSPEIYRESFRDSEPAATKNAISTVMIDTRIDNSPLHETDEELEEIYQKYVGDGDYIKFDIPEDLLRYAAKVEKQEEESKQKISRLDTQKESLHTSMMNEKDMTGSPSPYMRQALTRKTVLHSPKTPGGGSVYTYEHNHYKSTIKLDHLDPLQLSDRKRKKINYDNIAYSVQYRLRMIDHIFKGTLLLFKADI
jgi:hypothetical protein